MEDTYHAHINVLLSCHSDLFDMNGTDTLKYDEVYALHWLYNICTVSIICYQKRYVVSLQIKHRTEFSRSRPFSYHKI